MYYQQPKSDATSSIKHWRLFLLRLPSHSSCFSAQATVWLMWDVQDVSPLDHELLGGNNSPPTATWTDLLESVPTLSFSLLSQGRQASVPVRGSPFNQDSGFHVSSTQGPCSHRSTPPTLQHLVLILHIFLHTKMFHSLPLSLVLFQLELGFLLFVIALSKCRLCMHLHFLTLCVIVNPHIYLHPSHSSKAVFTKSMAISTLPNPKAMHLLSSSSFSTISHTYALSS